MIECWAHADPQGFRNRRRRRGTLRSLRNWRRRRVPLWSHHLGSLAPTLDMCYLQAPLAPSPPPKQVLTLVPPCLIVVLHHPLSRLPGPPRPANHLSAQVEAEQQLLLEIIPRSVCIHFYVSLRSHLCPRTPTTLEGRCLAILLALNSVL